MSTIKGIFDSFSNQSAARQDSPFIAVPEPAVAPAAGPFMAVPRQDSPFTLVEEVRESPSAGTDHAARLPGSRKVDSPFQIAEPAEGFGYEAAPKAYAASPFEAVPTFTPTVVSPFSAAPAQPAASPFSAAPAQAAASPFIAVPAQPAASPFSAAPAQVAASPFSAAPAQAAASPFSVESPQGPSASTQAALAAFGNWQEPAASAASRPPVEPVSPFAQPAPSVFTPVPEAPRQAPAVPVAVPVEAFDASQSDSFSIRQLELRAIFGVDREMNVEEILQRTRALPGMRNIARVGVQDMSAVEAIRHLLPNLGFGNGGLKLYSGSVPLEFIREGSVMLAVQTDGGFAPGVRETLMLVARELGRIS